jgi:uncharacterized OB-fold protein
MANTIPVMGLYDRPMWDSIAGRRLSLQTCLDCGHVRYPPGPNCPDCLSFNDEWRPVSGRGRVLSWVVFQRRYFDDFPPPYNSVAVRLEEGPIIVTNLIGPEPEGSWIGAEVELDYVQHGDRIQHAARLVTPTGDGSDPA